MNIKEMRQLPDDELRSEIDKARDKVFRMRFQGKGKDLENPGLLGTLKKDIARLETVLSERRIRNAARAAAAADSVSKTAVSTAAETAPRGGDASAKGEGES
jgi:large subunit ribosomal protein L29